MKLVVFVINLGRKKYKKEARCHIWVYIHSFKGKKHKPPHHWASLPKNLKNIEFYSLQVEAMSTVLGKSSAHVFILPYPAPGHIIPILDLTHQLLTRGLTITILVTPTTLSLVEPLLSNYPSSLKHLLLPFPQLPSTTKFRPIAYMRSMQ